MTSTLQEPSRAEVWKMFDKISSTYDKTNRLMTLGLDLYWRKKVASFLPKKNSIHLLDCATGTGDQLLSLLKHSPLTTKITQAVGIDLSQEMLGLAKNKLKEKTFDAEVLLEVASALDLPFAKESFDCVTMSFGIRNVLDVNLCLQELYRVLKPGGKLLILETSIPKAALIKKLHLFYLRKVLPRIGGLISKQKHAYQYLNQTTETFSCGAAFCEQIKQIGFSKVTCHPLTFGAVSIYEAEKRT